MPGKGVITTSPLIRLAKIGQISLLHELCEEAARSEKIDRGALNTKLKPVFRGNPANLEIVLQ